MAAGPPIQLTPQVRTDAPTSDDPAVVAVLKGPLPPSPPETTTTSTITNVPGTTSPVVLLAANANRLGFSIRNTSMQDVLYVKASNQITLVSSNFHTVALVPQAYYEDPYHYVGIVTGVWSGATGAALVDEYTP